MCFRGGGLIATFMSVPETSVHKDDGLVFGENDIGAAGEFFVIGGVDRKAVAGLVEQAAELDLGLGVFALYSRHIPGTAFFCQMISHGLGVIAFRCLA